MEKDYYYDEDGVLRRKKGVMQGNELRDIGVEEVSL